MRATVALVIVTVLLAAVTAAWTPVVVPKVVLLPTDFDTTVTVAGTFEAYTAPGTLARLPAPATLPLNATLQVSTVSTSGNNLVIKQVATQKVGAPTGPTQDLVLNSQYVIDRRTAQNVDDPQAWSISPSHSVNRAGSYSFTFGFSFDPAATYPWWDDSFAASYPLVAGGDAASADSGGLTVAGMTATATKPADPVWIAALTPLQLPKSLTPDQWTAAGFTVTATDAQVNANYFITLSSQVSIDLLTGGTANLTAQALTIAVAPDPSATGGKPTEPQTVAANRYSETPASVATDTQLLQADGNQVKLAETTIPRILLAATIVFALLTLVVFLLQRRTRRSLA